MLKLLLRTDVELAVTTAQGLGNVFADPGQLGQVIMNLVVNARDAIVDRGKVTIATANVEIDAAYAVRRLGVAPGPYVVLSVADTGAGMDAATQARVFDPFFTTKEQGKGTGLGLSMVLGIVEQSGGHIDIQSKPGVGTTFRVYFPRTDATAPAAAAADPSPTVRIEGRETVLIVEDDEQVRTLMRTILRRKGYDVLEAANGEDALLVSERHAGEIHLLVSDVLMPMMSGTELVARIGPTRPQMKVLYVSGYTEDTIIHRGTQDDGAFAFFQKPITPAAFLQKVREVLAG
jgi:CheY-like chemotaxis protein